MDNVYTRAMHLRPPKILGRRMQPFSAHHALTLCMLDNPYLIGGSPKLSDAIMVWLVCCDLYQHRHRTYFRFMASSRFRFFVRILIAYVRPEVFSANVIGYLAAFRVEPEYWTTGDAKRSRITGPFRIPLLVMHHYPQISENTAWNMAWLKASSYISVMDEIDGVKIAEGDLDVADEIDAKAEVGRHE